MSTRQTSSSAPSNVRLPRAARRSPTQARSRQSVALCLKTAQELFQRNGLDGVTTKKIAEAAGLSVGAVYAYFPNKEAIICQLGATWMAGIRVAIAELAPPRSGIPDAFGYADAFIDMGVVKYDSKSGLGTVLNMLSAIPELRELERAHDEDVVASLVAAFRHFFPRGPLEDVEALAWSLFSMTHATLSGALVDGTCERHRAIRNLRIAVYALIAQLAVPLRDVGR